MQDKNSTIKKLDLGGLKGQHNGFKAVNICEPCDTMHDLDKRPWPFADGSVSEVIMKQLLIHLKEPLEAMKEIHRICTDGAIVRIMVPFWKNARFGDPWIYNVFRRKWFRKLCNMDIPAGGTGRREQKGHWIPFRFRMLDMRYYRGRFRFWKKYSLNVILRVDKRARNTRCS